MKKHGRARQGAAGGTSDGAVSSRLEGTPASPSARTFARTSSGGLGGLGEQRCFNTRCQPCSRRGCPCPDLSGPPCSHARASGLGTAGGCGVAMLAARRLRFRGHRSRGRPRGGRGHGHHAGVLGFRVDGRSRRAVSGVRRKGAVVAVLVRRPLAERLRSIGEQARRLVRQRTGGSAFERASSVEGAPCPQARARRSRGGSKMRRGLSAVVVAKSRPRGENQELQRLVGQTPLRQRTPERRAHRGSKRVKRREPRHPPGLSSSGSRRGSRVLIFDNWVARPLSTGHGRCHALRKEPCAVESRRGRNALERSAAVMP
jgi:hypothetical protein